jgi:thioredoxin reductase (NADPH)
MQSRVFKTENIEMVWDSVPKEILGKKEGFSKAVTGLLIENLKTGEEKTIDIDGFFVAIGHKPNSDLFKGKLDMDETGYLITKSDSTATNIPGIFAAGDIQDKIYRQAVTAAGTGCMAALEAERFLADQE